MRFGICNEIFQGWSLDRTFQFAREVGYDAVEIAPFTIATDVREISQEQRKEIRRSAEQTGILISGIHWVLVQTEGMHLTHPDAAVRGRTSAYFEALVDFCAEIGGRFIIVGSPKQRNLVEGVTVEQGVRWAQETFRPAVARAEKKNVVICFEPLGPGETNFINTAEAAINLVAPLNSSAFKIILDVKAMSSEAKPIPEIIRQSKGNFAYFHANDKNLKGPGFGDIDFAPIGAALKEVGYDGFVSVEVFNFDEGPEEIARRSLAYLKKHF
jgi:sugar phosphate isomerase/epimerase